MKFDIESILSILLIIISFCCFKFFKRFADEIFCDYEIVIK